MGMFPNAGDIDDLIYAMCGDAPAARSGCRAQARATRGHHGLFGFGGAVELEEGHDASYRIKARVPGVPASGVRVTLTDDGALSLLATAPDGNIVLRETVRLPDDADPTQGLSSWCVDGLLEIKVPRLPPPDPVSISVNSSEPPELGDGDEKPYEIRRNIPGFGADDVSIRVEFEPADASVAIIVIEAKRGAGEKKFSAALPEDAFANLASAFVCNGVVTVLVPRRAGMEVNVADAVPTAIEQNKTEQPPSEVNAADVSPATAEQNEAEPPPPQQVAEVHVPVSASRDGAGSSRDAERA